jgi:hypothetical protein
MSYISIVIYGPEVKEDLPLLKVGWMREQLLDLSNYFIIIYSGIASFKKKTSNFNGQYKNMSENNLTTAYWCREQNFRKYFEMRKKHGISPSIDTDNFYKRDTCKQYYEGLLEASFMAAKVEKITG